MPAFTLLSSLLACGEAPPAAAVTPVAEAEAAPLTVPEGLASLGLPVGAGAISQATPHLLEVDYPAGTDHATLGKQWVGAFEAAGFDIKGPRTAPVAEIWDVTPPNEHAWTLSVVDLHGRVEVHVNGLWGSDR